MKARSPLTFASLALALLAFTFPSENPAPVKHQLTFAPYTVSQGSVVKLPDQCTWQIHYPVTSEKGQILLALAEQYSDKEGFWSVMSYLTPDEARNLSKELKDAADAASMAK